MNNSPKNHHLHASPVPNIEISSEEDLPEISIAYRSKTNSDISNYNSKRIFEQKRWIWRYKHNIHGLVFENIQAIKCDSVPPDIDDTIFYEVPIGSSGKLTHCKGLRPWGYAKSSKSKEFKNRPILLFSCRGACCKNIKCLNISDFGVNRAEFQKETIKPHARCVEMKLPLHLEVWRVKNE